MNEIEPLDFFVRESIAVLEPAEWHAIDQQMATTRHQLRAMGVSLDDPKELQSVVATTRAIARHVVNHLYLTCEGAPMMHTLEHIGGALAIFGVVLREACKTQGVEFYAEVEA